MRFITWCNKDRKEIYFILNCQNISLPVEVKLNFCQFNPSAVNYFNSRYGQKEYRLIGLDGNRCQSALKIDPPSASKIDPLTPCCKG